ncbi:ATP-dependent Zn protease [Rhizobium sp. Leaf306]|uniref:AAA family ATPase n=1 Tax=Rhizobium sp. Leaf306 TaxID=1736330 RepID=UPI0007155675|nr:AAA family ATPase [Rhizobium sp. Leaf306]KQQ36500.1 ATP-dependent Zn protease [Rhizobium sp. Leaf306]
MSNDKLNEAVRSSVKHHSLYLTLLRALTNFEPFFSGGPGIVGLITPPEHTAKDYLAAAGAYLYDGAERGDHDAYGILCVGTAEKDHKIEYNFKSDLSGKTRGILISEIGMLPPLVVVSVDAILPIEPITPDDLRQACKVAIDVRVTLKQARGLLTFPPDVMFSALRRNRSAADALKRLQNSSARKATTVDPGPCEQLFLENLHGYGQAKTWGLQLATDLNLWQQKRLAWSDVDRGLLLSGPPGVGKTIFARALANTCGVNFVATSVAQWQADGHLGDTLKAMRKEFAKASVDAPSILFIDELDSIGDRATFPTDHANYSSQVVNALLECLDGTAARDGVVVVGATNHPDKIDPAVRRPGRLDRHVVIDLPSQEDRLAIIRQQLGPDGSIDLGDLGPLTEAMAGADLAQLVRDAKRLARREGRGLVLADLTSQLPPLIPITGPFRRSAAVHEAGHALVGVRLEYGRFRGAFVHRQLNPRFKEQLAGAAGFELPVVWLRNEQKFRDQICVLLAGIAAEKLIFGSHSDGAEADLAEATRLALEMETQNGMGTKLLRMGKRGGWDQLGLQQHHWVVESVNNILVRELARGQEILDRERHLLLAAANEIDKEAHLSPERFAELEAGLPEARLVENSQEKSRRQSGGHGERKPQRPSSRKEVRS